VRRPWSVILCGAAIVTLAMGVRQAFGLVQPFVGAIADRNGAGRVIFLGALLYIAGLVAAALATSAIGLHLSFGVAIGMALSATTFVVVLGVVGRVVPPERRSLSFGIVTAGGSLGQFLVVPVGQLLLAELGYRTALVALAGLIALCCPLALGLAGKPAAAAGAEPPQLLSQALGEASRHSGFWLLNAGFFVCGFHVAFIATHFPAYLNDRGLGLRIGATALALIGLFNIFGSYAFGVAGDRLRKKWVLSALYGGRAIVLSLFLLAPLSEASALAFAAAMGFLWLGTVPLTSGLVGQIFGIRYLSTLYGIVFLSHQIGSFFGAWAAGYAYDRLGSYDAAWAASIALALLATALHLPIRDAPVARLQTA
jgi:predicted MFS family arabinose efflux permease